MNVDPGCDHEIHFVYSSTPGPDPPTARAQQVKRNLSLVLLVVGLLLSSCGSDSEGAAVESDPTTSTTSTTEDAPSTNETTRSGSEDGDWCEAFVDVAALAGQIEDIATGSFERQVAADQLWSDSLEQISASAPDDGDLLSALDTLAALSFQVTESDAGTNAEDLDAALAEFDAAYGDYCGDAPIECPAPETLSDLGLQCDSEGQVTPAEGEPDADGVLGPLEECPAPETLEANGYTCDAEGYLTPVG